MDVVVIVVEWNCIVTMKILLVSTDIRETAEMVIQDSGNDMVWSAGIPVSVSCYLSHM